MITLGENMQASQWYIEHEVSNEKYYIILTLL